MDQNYLSCLESLRQNPRRWLVTGAAGFIGSHLVQALLTLGQEVTGLDNLSTGNRGNLLQVKAEVSTTQWAKFRFSEGDIRSLNDCRDAVAGVHTVLHQAALGSVPRSLADPLTSHDVNTTGFLNMLIAARDEGVQRFVYAASSSTYGDHAALPKVENRIGNPLSPYAVTKYVNELYAGVFARNFGMSLAGLRYFNVFGPRQDPDGAYAAVIPFWIKQMLLGETVFINGDGLTTRDFCFVGNAVQANLLAATRGVPASSEVFNIAVAERMSLLELFQQIREGLTNCGVRVAQTEPQMRAFREGDVRHSLADIGKAKHQLGYEPSFSFQRGLIESLPWYILALAD